MKFDISIFVIMMFSPLVNFPQKVGTSYLHLPLFIVM